MIFLSIKADDSEDWSTLLQAQSAALEMGYGVKWLDYPNGDYGPTFIFPDEESAAVFKLAYL